MLFNSYIFIFLFLPVTLLVFYLLARFKKIKTAQVSLVIASLIFYAYWDIRYLPLLLLSMTFNYIMGSKIEYSRDKKLLAFSVGVDLALLGYFKYTDFFLQTVNTLGGTSIPLPHIILPLGISFFTFTQIAYLVDAYRGETEKYSLSSFSLFVSFFPHLIAGPILYHKKIIPQFNDLKNYVFSSKNMSLGVSLFAMGLFKKVMIADNLAPWAQAAFSHAQQLTFMDAWAGALAYTLQLYFDFSAYSEMAIGLGLMLNIELPINFNSPYKSTSIVEFWRRWHMTLSEFLKNYLYIPLGGNRHGESRRMTNVFLTMLLGGLWHGAGWTFVVWGGLHGVFIVINHQWRRLKIKLPAVLSWLLTMICVTVCWVFFRAESLPDALHMVQAMFGLHGLPQSLAGILPGLQSYGLQFATAVHLPGGTRELLVLGGLMLILAVVPNPQQIVARLQPNWRWAIIIALLMAVSILGMEKATDFLYFQF
jgi:Predicted membrane protein involved in D-alanine export